MLLGLVLDGTITFYSNVRSYSLSNQFVKIDFFLVRNFQGNSQAIWNFVIKSTGVSNTFDEEF